MYGYSLIMKLLTIVYKDKDDAPFEFVNRLSKELGAIGIIDSYSFKRDGKYYNSRIDLRFSVGCESGVNVPKLIINNWAAKEYLYIIGQYEEKI